MLFIFCLLRIRAYTIYVDFALAGTEGGGRNGMRPPVFSDQGEAEGMKIPAREARARRTRDGEVPEGYFTGTPNNFFCIILFDVFQLF